MKILLLLSIFASLVFADEISRIESIVKDIGELRHKYELCQDELDKVVNAPKQCEVNKMELKARHQEILFLQKENEELEKKDSSKLLHVTQISKEKDKALTYLRAENKRLSKQLKDREKKSAATLSNVQKISKEKDKALAYLRSENKRLSKENEKIKSLKKEIASLKDELANAIKNRDIVYKTHDESLAKLEKEILKLKNTIKKPLPKIDKKEKKFPNLKMKKGFEHLQEDDSIDWSVSGAYRLKHDAKIYDGIDGKVIDTWRSQRSFTSAVYKDGWVRITGYFIDKKWTSSKDKSLWIKRKDVYRR